MDKGHYRSFFILVYCWWNQNRHADQELYSLHEQLFSHAFQPFKGLQSFQQLIS